MLETVLKPPETPLSDKSWGWTTWRKPNTPETILARCEKVGECLVWHGSMTNRSHPNHGGAQPQGSVKGYRTLRLREVIWLAAGLTRSKRDSISVLCGELRCLNVEHMATGSYAPSRHGKLTSDQRAEIKRLYLEGLWHKARWKERQEVRLGERFGVTRERIRQVLAIELAIPITLLGKLSAAYVEDPTELDKLRSREAPPEAGDVIR